MKPIKRFRAKFNPDRKGVYSVSIVDEPAMEGDFIQFNKEDKVQFAFMSENKTRVMGLILQPDKDVLRFDEETQEHYNVFFTAEDIKDVAYNFQRQGHQNNSTRQHDGVAIEGVSFVETWLVENPKIDKSANFGFNYPKGSWVGVMDITNKEILKDIELGKYKGFSIDALMQFEEQLNLNQLKMSENKKDNDLLSAIDTRFAQLKEFLKPKEVKLAEHEEPKKEEEEEVKLEEKEEEKVDLMEHEDEDKDKAKMAEHTDINSMLEKIIANIQEMMTPLMDEDVEMKKEAVELAKRVDAIEKSNVAFAKENESLKAEVLTLSKQPATKSIKQAPVQLEYSKMSNLQKMEHNMRNSKT
jgi:hypothetical protein